MSKSAVDSWIKEFKNVCTYWRIRRKALRLFSTEEGIFKKTFFHQIPYKFQYHQAKLKMFIKDYFSELARYLKDTPKKVKSIFFCTFPPGPGEYISEFSFWVDSPSDYC